MKKLIVFLLISIVFLQSATRLLVIVYYQSNKAYIASNLCENRFNPSKNCQGRCYLKKTLQSTETNKTDSTYSINLSLETEFCLINQFAFAPTILTKNIHLQYAQTEGHIVHRTFEFLKPPRS